jgi:alkylated DNA repair protein alkB family protein 7
MSVLCLKENREIIIFVLILADKNVGTNLMEFEGEWPEDMKEKFINDMGVIENFITPDEETTIMSEIEPHLKRQKYEFSGNWDEAINGFRETERKSWFPQNRTVIDRLVATSFSKESSILNHVHVLDLAKDGVILPHVDSVRYCGSTVSGISLLSDCVMKLVQSKEDPFTAADSYRSQPKNDDPSLYSCKILIRRYSLYIMSGVARYNFTHEVLKDEESFFRNQRVERERRISIICRNEP